MTEQANETFGISTETKSKNSTPFNPGITKGILTDVKKEEVGKTDKYLVLTFTFKDVEGNRTYRHSEFTVKSTDDKKDVKVNGLNVRIKHIYEAFAPFPATGLGMGATSWDQFFGMVESAFNTGNNGKPIYVREEAEKKIPVVTWLKLVYDKKDNLTFPMFPNFIERITEANTNAPKTIVIDKKFDRLEQSGGATASTSPMGSGVIPPGNNDFGF